MVQSVQRPIQHLTIEDIRDEALQLVYLGKVSRRQPIYVMCQHIPAREWADVECELERNSFLLRDRIGDLISAEDWQND